MTSYKVCLTFLVLVGVGVTASALYDPTFRRRDRRANDGKDQSGESPTDDGEYNGFQAGYRFGEEFFLPESSKSIPAEYKKRADGCERVTKDSMVCMVCRDSKTNAKYEQCSYVGNPPPEPTRPRQSPPIDDEKRSYVGESSDYAPSPRSSGNYESSTPFRGSDENYESSESPRTSYETFEADKPAASTRRDDERDVARAPYSYSENSNERSESSEIPAESSGCRDVEKDSETCRICKDPKTGKDFERCSSRYRPNDETYAYGNTEKYGYPESREYDEDEKTGSESDDNKSENAEEPAESSDCRRVVKNDRRCTICKDPKTGRNTERCSSGYGRPVDGKSGTRRGSVATRDDENYDKIADATYEIPSDYEYGYSKSTDETDENYSNDRPEEYRRSSYDGPSGEAEYAAPSASAASTKTPKNDVAEGCYEVRKDSTTCTVCKDPKTGGNLEKCSYAYQPNDNVYKFTKSKSFGYPEGGEGKRNRRKDNENVKASADYADRSESKQVGKPAETSSCKQIEKDSMICTVCSDSKTGASSEQCAYGSKPSEKRFSYTASKSFGKPSEKSRKTGENFDSEERQESRIVPQRFDEHDRQSVGESKRVEQSIDNNSCRIVEKDSMTCSVCKDPKTGASSEECRSNSSGPKENGYSNDNESESSAKDVGDVVETAETTSPCRKIEKDSMTCTVCKDPKTGGNYEQCAYSYKPKERRFAYSKSKSFGNPRRKTEEGGKKQIDGRKKSPKSRKSDRNYEE